MTQVETMESACPSCGQGVTTEDPLLGELITCPACDAELEVRGVSPLVIAIAPEIEEDWGE